MRGAARLALTGWTALALAGCFPTLEGDAYTSGTVVLAPPGGGGGAHPVAVPGEVDPEGAAGSAFVELQYLGVAGWRVETPRTVLLTAPLLTRPSMWEVGRGAELAPDTAAILAALDAWKVGPLDPAVAILVGHGHYDHLLDTPWMASRLAPRARILGNATTRLQAAAFADELGLDPSRLEDVSARAASPRARGEWIHLAPDLRVLPVVGDHAPHFAGHTLYSGTRERAMTVPPGPATEWLDGETLAFLVDVLRDDGSVGLRIYYQDAIPREPAGMLPAEVLAEAPVDLALLVPASFAEVRWHPEALVENLQPRRVLVQHWESFFDPALAPPEPVAFTILPHFMDRLRRVMPCGDECIRIPLPGARFRIPIPVSAGSEPGAGVGSPAGRGLAPVQSPGLRPGSGGPPPQ